MIINSIGLIIIVLVLYFILKNKVEYKGIIEFESFDKNSDEDYNKRVDDNRLMTIMKK